MELVRGDWRSENFDLFNSPYDLVKQGFEQKGNEILE